MSNNTQGLLVIAGIILFIYLAFAIHWALGLLVLIVGTLKMFGDL
jgi:hypothetical protein